MAPSSSAPTAVLFDLDGVLLHSEEVWFRLVEEAGRRWRGTPVTWKEFHPTFGQGTDADVESFRLTCTVEQLDKFYAENFQRYASGVWVDPLSKPLLQDLASKGVRRAVVTNTTSKLAPALLDQAGLSDLVEVVVCADQVPQGKPEPDILLKALQSFSLDANSAWMLGDSRFDRSAAKAAGVRFVGLRIDGDHRIESLAELIPLMNL